MLTDNHIFQIRGAESFDDVNVKEMPPPFFFPVRLRSLSMRWIGKLIDSVVDLFSKPGFSEKIMLQSCISSWNEMFRLSSQSLFSKLCTLPGVHRVREGRWIAAWDWTTCWLACLFSGNACKVPGNRQCYYATVLICNGLSKWKQKQKNTKNIFN